MFFDTLRDISSQQMQCKNCIFSSGHLLQPKTAKMTVYKVSAWNVKYSKAGKCGCIVGSRICTCILRHFCLHCVLYSAAMAWLHAITKYGPLYLAKTHMYVYTRTYMHPCTHMHTDTDIFFSQKSCQWEIMSDIFPVAWATGLCNVFQTPKWLFYLYGVHLAANHCRPYHISKERHSVSIYEASNCSTLHPSCCVTVTPGTGHIKSIVKSWDLKNFPL